MNVVSPYFSQLFPYETVFALITDDYFFPLNVVEIAFTYLIDGEGEVFSRYPSGTNSTYSFIDCESVQEHLAFKTPCSIQMGGIYWRLTTRQQLKKDRADPELLCRSPLVFDVDANDYADVRTCGCGEEKKVCNQCWTDHIVPAANTIERICRELGFRRILRVFSGRRGVHIWVFDRKAYYLLTEQRAAICQRIQMEGVRLDIPVTTKASHLKKLFLSIHSGTGNVCAPITSDFLPERDAVNVRFVTRQLMDSWIKILSCI